MIEYINDGNGNLVGVMIQQAAIPINTTPFVEVQAAAEKLIAEQANLSKKLEIDSEKLKKAIEIVEDYNTPKTTSNEKAAKTVEIINKALGAKPPRKGEPS